MILLLCLIGLSMAVFNHNWEAMLAWMTAIIITGANMALVKKYKLMQILSQNLVKETEKFFKGRVG